MGVPKKAKEMRLFLTGSEGPVAVEELPTIENRLWTKKNTSIPATWKSPKDPPQDPGSGDDGNHGTARKNDRKRRHAVEALGGDETACGTPNQDDVAGFGPGRAEEGDSGGAVAGQKLATKISPAATHDSDND